MPNIITHMAVAAEFHSISSDALLGSALPDFVGMYRDYQGTKIRIDELDNQDLRDGIRLHYATDAAYDNQKLRNDVVRAMSAKLRRIAPSLGKGARLACADVATDVLLDGIVIEDHARTIYQQVKRDVLDDKTSLKNSKETAFEDSIKHYFAQDIPYRYSDTQWLAAMLHNRFEHRRGRWLTFDKATLPVLARTFDEHTPRLRRISTQLITLTAEETYDLL